MLRKFLVAGAAMASLTLAQAATVQTFALGVLDNAAVPIGGIRAIPNEIFTDLYTFSVSGPGVGAGAAFDVSAAYGIPGVSFTILGVSLLDAAQLEILGDSDGSDGFGVIAPLLAAGDYTFAVAGVTGEFGGEYSGAVQTLTAAVPEPETYALMMLGLAAVAVVSRRRRV